MVNKITPLSTCSNNPLKLSSTKETNFCLKVIEKMCTERISVF